MHVSPSPRFSPLPLRSFPFQQIAHSEIQFNDHFDSTAFEIPAFQDEMANEIVGRFVGSLGLLPRQNNFSLVPEETTNPIFDF